MNNKKLKLDENGYNEYLEYIEKLKTSLDSNNKDRSEAAKNDPGNGWHDNFDFETTRLKEANILKRISDAQKDLKNIEIIKETDITEDKVNINDMIELKLTFTDGHEDVSYYKLIGGNFPLMKDEYAEITLNSALGQKLFNAKIGSTFSYEGGNGDLIQAAIIRKIK